MRSRIVFLGAAALLSGPWLSLPVHAAQQPDTAAGPSFRLRSAASGQAQPVLTLDQAIALALSANPALRAAELGIGVADGARLQAESVPNPELSVQREGTQRGSRTRTIQLSQPLELGGKRAARVQLAEQERALAASEWQVQAAQLQADVTDAYLAALTAQQRVELAQGALELAGKASQAAVRRVAAGKISPLEATRANVAATGVRLELLQAQADLAGANGRLAALWGSTLSGSQLSDRALNYSLSTPEPDALALPPLEVLQAQLEASPQVRRAGRQVQRDEAQVQLERTQRVPDVALTLGSKRDETAGATQAVIGLSVPLPLFHRNQGNVLSAQRRVEQAKSRLEAEILVLAQAVADAWQRAHVAQEHLDAIRADMLPAATSALQAAVTGFELGKFNFLDVLDAQRTLAQVRTQYLNTLSERCRAIADVQRYVALPEPRKQP